MGEVTTPTATSSHKPPPPHHVVEQEELRGSLLETDTESWAQGGDLATSGLRLLGGCDVSYLAAKPDVACATLAVLSFPELEVVYEDSRLVDLSAPYVPGFLAARESRFILDAVLRLRETRPELEPQVMMVDGNGILHYKGFGLACHLGVLAALPCVGVAKDLLQVDGLQKDGAHRHKIKALNGKGDTFPLVGNSGKILGMAVRSSSLCSNPVYVSVGHRVSLDTAVRLTLSCSKFRVPEPIRQADIRSREFLREKFPIPQPRLPRGSNGEQEEEEQGEEEEKNS
uniref:Endonuclease V n=1 Tax=Petromyzon marinus TaxID=7757 RepID=A0AAJ7U918_PETMA|nr:endonuclease V isoform X2 [Petromyzon marinus]